MHKVDTFSQTQFHLLHIKAGILNIIYYDISQYFGSPILHGESCDGRKESKLDLLRISHELWSYIFFFDS